ncbi:mitochondrial ribosome-associated GTPase 1-like isoform X2 [Halichondria panicea]|uniref:mitochondrial ribosome-associated GTPase 1-like isoform X2 n=1 Tax=Halichondria panicea TaxID=6063 RepID=UPI00312BB152
MNSGSSFSFLTYLWPTGIQGTWQKIPFSGRNPNFDLMLKGIPKLLVLNKVDLCDQSKCMEVATRLRDEGEKDLLFSNMRKQHHKSVKELMSKIKKATQSMGDDSKALKLMVVGMPNVGKSSLINALRRNNLGRGRATAVGKLPGVTRSVLFKIRICEHPEIFLYDTPGVMIPKIDSEESALKLAITGILKDNIMNDYLIADYLLFILNQHRQFDYAKFYGLPEPMDDIAVVLSRIAKRLGALQKGGSLDIVRAAIHFIHKYRNGELGRITLDQITTSEQLASGQIST